MQLECRYKCKDECLSICTCFYMCSVVGKTENFVQRLKFNSLVTTFIRSC